MHVKRAHKTVDQSHEGRHGVHEGKRQKRRVRVESRRRQEYELLDGKSGWIIIPLKHEMYEHGRGAQRMGHNVQFLFRGVVRTNGRRDVPQHALDVVQPQLVDAVSPVPEVVGGRASSPLVADALVRAAVAQPYVGARVVGGERVRPDRAVAHPSERRIEHAMHEKDDLLRVFPGQALHVEHVAVRGRNRVLLERIPLGDRVSESECYICVRVRVAFEFECISLRSVPPPGSRTRSSRAGSPSGRLTAAAC